MKYKAELSIAMLMGAHLILIWLWLSVVVFAPIAIMFGVVGFDLSASLSMLLPVSVTFAVAGAVMALCCGLLDVGSKRIFTRKYRRTVVTFYRPSLRTVVLIGGAYVGWYIAARAFVIYNERLASS